MKKGPADTPMAAGKTKNGKRYQPAEKLGHVKAFRSSGLSQVRYAKKVGVTPQTLASWLKAYPVQATGRASGAGGKFKPGAVVDLKEDDFFARVKDEPLSLEEQNQRLRIAIKAMARMI